MPHPYCIGSTQSRQSLAWKYDITFFGTGHNNDSRMKDVSWRVGRSIAGNKACCSAPWKCPCSAGAGSKCIRSAPDDTCGTWQSRSGQSPAGYKWHTESHVVRGSESRSKADLRGRKNSLHQTACGIPAPWQHTVYINHFSTVGIDNSHI